MFATHVEAGITGAKRQSWRKGNPRDVLARVVKDNPAASESEINALVWQIVRHNTEQIGAIFEYWFANNYRSLTRGGHMDSSGTAPLTFAAKEEQREARKIEAAAVANAIKAKFEEKIEEKIEERAKIALLTMILPTGKTVQDSTREELADLGGWTRRVAKKLRPGQTVGEAGLTEDQLKAAYG